MVFFNRKILLKICMFSFLLHGAQLQAWSWAGMWDRTKQHVAPAVKLWEGIKRSPTATAACCVLVGVGLGCCIAKGILAFLPKRTRTSADQVVPAEGQNVGFDHTVPDSDGSIGTDNSDDSSEYNMSHVSVLPQQVFTWSKQIDPLRRKFKYSCTVETRRDDNSIDRNPYSSFDPKLLMDLIAQAYPAYQFSRGEVMDMFDRYIFTKEELRDALGVPHEGAGSACDSSEEEEDESTFESDESDDASTDSDSD